MHPTIHTLDAAIIKKDIPAFRAGDTLKVYCKVKEGDKARVQIFEGVVIARHNDGARSSFTIRKMSFSIGVERVFPLYSPNIEKIEIVTKGDVRRAKLYYLRELVGKSARIKTQEYKGPVAKAAVVVPEVGA